MSHPAEGVGQRRANRGGEDAINRKKQKDRMNQESKEGKMASGGDAKRGEYKEEGDHSPSDWWLNNPSD